MWSYLGAYLTGAGLYTYWNIVITVLAHIGQSVPEIADSLQLDKPLILINKDWWQQRLLYWRITGKSHAIIPPLKPHLSDILSLSRDVFFKNPGVFPLDQYITLYSSGSCPWRSTASWESSEDCDKCLFTSIMCGGAVSWLSCWSTVLISVLLFWSWQHTAVTGWALYVTGWWMSLYWVNLFFALHIGTPALNQSQTHLQFTYIIYLLYFIKLLKDNLLMFYCTTLDNGS